MRRRPGGSAPGAAAKRAARTLPPTLCGSSPSLCRPPASHACPFVRAARLSESLTGLQRLACIDAEGRQRVLLVLSRMLSAWPPACCRNSHAATAYRRLSLSTGRSASADDQVTWWLKQRRLRPRCVAALGAGALACPSRDDPRTNRLPRRTLMCACVCMCTAGRRSPGASPRGEGSAGSAGRLHVRPFVHVARRGLAAHRARAAI